MNGHAEILPYICWHVFLWVHIYVLYLWSKICANHSEFIYLLVEYRGLKIHVSPHGPEEWNGSFFWHYGEKQTIFVPRAALHTFKFRCTVQIDFYQISMCADTWILPTMHASTFPTRCYYHAFSILRSPQQAQTLHDAGQAYTNAHLALTRLSCQSLGHPLTIASVFTMHGPWASTSWLWTQSVSTPEVSVV